MEPLPQLTPPIPRHAHNPLERLAQAAAHATGQSWAFALAALVVLAWVATGPFFHFSDTWQLVINTSTTIVTFLMVFLIQRAQNKDALALQLKLNEIIAALPDTSNRLVDIESLEEHELELLHQHFHALAEMAKHDYDLHTSHSIDETRARHAAKRAHRAHKPR